MNKERIKIMRIAASAEVDECLDEIERLQKIVGAVEEIQLGDPVVKVVRPDWPVKVRPEEEV